MTIKIRRSGQTVHENLKGRSISISGTAAQLGNLTSTGGAIGITVSNANKGHDKCAVGCKYFEINGEIVTSFRPQYQVVELNSRHFSQMPVIDNS